MGVRLGVEDVEESEIKPTKGVRGSAMTTVITPGAAKGLAAIAKGVGSVYEIRKGRPAHIWPWHQKRSFCGVSHRGSPKLPGLESVDFESNKVCKKCLQSLRLQIAGMMTRT